jgi:hypothetical protein
MEFFIKKNATLPLLKMQVVKDGRSDFNKMMDLIEQSAIFFSMVDADTGIPKIITRPAGFVAKKFLDPNAEPEYYVYYQFNGSDTRTVGRYEGQFLLRNDDGVLILPIREKLYINIQESFIANDLEYDSCYVVDFPCCVDIPIITTTTTQQPTVLTLNLQTTIAPGSTIVNYFLTANQDTTQNVSLYFNHVLGVYSGTPITISTGVTISSGAYTGVTQVVLDENYNNLTRNDYYLNIQTSPNGVPFQVANDFFPFTPTPTPSVTPTNTPTPTPSVTPTNTPTPTPSVTPTNTPTPTPTPTPSPEVITNAIITNLGEYIEVGTNEYLTYNDMVYYVSVNVESGSTITTFSVTGETTFNQEVEIPMMVEMELVSGGTVIISDTVTILSGETVGTKINVNNLLNYNDLTKSAELKITKPTIPLFNCLFLAYPINFE